MDPFDPVCRISHCDDGKAHVAEFDRLVKAYADKNINLAPNLLLVDLSHISHVAKGDKGQYVHRKSRHFEHQYGDRATLRAVMRRMVESLPAGDVGMLANDGWVYRDLLGLSLSDKAHPISLYVPLDQLQIRSS